MIFNETLEGRTERFLRMLSIATNRMSAYTVATGKCDCRAHGPNQTLSAIRHPQLPSEFPCCTQCTGTFFSSAIPAGRPVVHTEHFVCNYQTCNNPAIPDVKCCWCARHYCTAHMDTSTCCDECAEEAGGDPNDEARIAQYTDSSRGGS